MLGFVPVLMAYEIGMDLSDILDLIFGLKEVK